MPNRFVYNSTVLAVLYFLGAVFLGDSISRRFLSFASPLHRVASALLTGLLFSTCITYLSALATAGSGSPLFWSNVVFFSIVGSILLLETGVLSRQGVASRPAANIFGGARYTAVPRPPGDWLWDAACIFFCLILGTWLMFATLHFSDGNFHFAIKSWSDFGANLSLAQSLALGNNYPTEHPFYPGEVVRYHFLFWFLAANLSYLGANIVWAINILSVLSLLALIVLLITFAETLFRSRAVGRIAAVLFFFASSSLSYIPFLWSKQGLVDTLQSVVAQKDFLKSGFPYRGDDWGALSVTVFANQRQLLSAVGLVLMVLIFLVEFYRSRGSLSEPPDASVIVAGDETPPQSLESPAVGVRDLRSLIFCGLLIGALPYWNSAVFVAASLILGSLFVLFPKRQYLLICIATVIVVGLPQLLLLRSGSIASTSHSLFNWGYIVAEPTVMKVIEYIGWTFGFKLGLIAVATALVPSSYRRLMLALTAPAIVVFLLQLSTDMFNNHKLLNIWSVLISVYVAYALWMIGRKSIARTALAAALAIAMILGSVIDLFPVHNDAFVSVPHHNDRLTDWLLTNTDPSDIFLSDTLLSHPILFTGRKLFLGNTLFAWTAGYQLAEREKLHRRMLTIQDLNELRRLLAENRIAYAAFDDGLRTNPLTRANNENLFRDNFALVFEDQEGKYGNLKLYRTKETSSPPGTQSP